MSSAYHFLVNHGFYDALVWSFTGGTVAFIFARRPIRTLLGLLGLHAYHQAQIADRLDTDTPGGITDLIDVLQRDEPPYKAMNRDPR